MIKYLKDLLVGCFFFLKSKSEVRYLTFFPFFSNTVSHSS